MIILNYILHLWGDRVTFIDNRIKVKSELNDITTAWLYEASGEIQSATQRNQTRVDTGKTKSSWTYVVDENKGEATVGSPDQNAIWEEFGTGEYALNGNGRKKPWKYQDSKGNWYTTKGKKPLRAFHNAFTVNKDKIQRALENKLKGMN